MNTRPVTKGPPIHFRLELDDDAELRKLSTSSSPGQLAREIVTAYLRGDLLYGQRNP